MKFVNPMKDTPEGKLLAIVRDIEKSLGIEKNSEAMGCKEDDEVKPDYLDMDKDGNKKESMKEAITGQPYLTFCSHTMTSIS